jgi:membrane protein
VSRLDPSLPRWLRHIGTALRGTLRLWVSHRADRLAAALAFYAIFSMAPLLVIVIAVAGQVFGPDAVRGEIVAQFGSLIGVEAALQVEVIIQGASNPASGLLAALIGGISLMAGATAVFAQLKEALNAIWDAPPLGRSFLTTVFRDRIRSLVMVLGVAFLLLVSLVLSAGLAALSRWAAPYLPDFPFSLARSIDFVLSFVLVSALFAMIYRFLPDVPISWGDVAIGAAVTAALFNFGKYLIGLYLGQSSLGSVFGAAGSLAILMVWVYYSASVFLLGAGFTRVYSLTWGSLSRPASGTSVTSVEAPASLLSARR